MPSDTEVSRALTDIIVRVVGCDAAAVVPEAELKSLGVDSLAVVEIAEGLEQRFGQAISDDTVDSLVTVQDAVDAVVRPQSTPPPAAPLASLRASLPPEELARRKRKATSYAAGFVVVGLMLGAVGGFGLAAVAKVMGLGTQDVPRAAATAEPTATKKPSPKPSPQKSAEAEDPDPKPSLEASSSRIVPGERVTLSGTFPGLSQGAPLQVQIKDADSGWDDFPVTTQVRDADGTFRTQIYTTRTGERQVRLRDEASGKSTPSVTVTIG